MSVKFCLLLQINIAVLWVAWVEPWGSGLVCVIQNWDKRRETISLTGSINMSWMYVYQKKPDNLLSHQVALVCEGKIWLEIRIINADSLIILLHAFSLFFFLEDFIPSLVHRAELPQQLPNLNSYRSTYESYHSSKMEVVPARLPSACLGWKHAPALPQVQSDPRLTAVQLAPLLTEIMDVYN